MLKYESEARKKKITYKAAKLGWANLMNKLTRPRNSDKRVI